MQERRRLPDGFLLMLLSHHFVVAFLVLTTFVVEPAVYNFMQTQKERQPCKIKASAINKKSARRGSNPRPPPWQGGAPPLSHSRILYRSKPVSRRYEINCVDIHPQSDECLLCVSQQRLYYMMNAKLSRKFLKFFVKFVI